MKLSKNMFLYKTSQIILDIIIFGFSFFAAYFIRLKGMPSGMHLKQFWILLPYIIIARFLMFYFLHIYSIVWRYISILDSLLLFGAVIPVTVVLFIGRLLLPNRFSLLRIPYSVITIEFLLVVLGILGIRMLRRLIHETRARSDYENVGHSKNVLLIGAGDAGNMVAKELKQRPDLGMKMVFL